MKGGEMPRSSVQDESGTGSEAVEAGAVGRGGDWADVGPLASGAAPSNKSAKAQSWAIRLLCCCCGEGPTSSRVTVYLAVVVVSLTSVLLGYDVGVMSSAILFISKDLDLSTLRQSVIVASLNLVAAPGGLLAGSVADTLGRKRSIALACCIFITGSLIKIVSTNFGMLLAGRVVTGVGVGCGFVVAPVYVSEIVPKSIRGALTSMTDIMINFGIVLGYVVGYICAVSLPTDGTRWRVMLGISLFPPFVILCCLVLLPESPRWLLHNGRHTPSPEKQALRRRQARQVLDRITDDPREAEAQLEEVEQSIEADVLSNSSGNTWSHLLLSPSPRLRATLWLGVCLGAAQQLSGSEAAVYYSPRVLSAAGLTLSSEILAANIAVGLFKLLGEVVAAGLTDRTGRRPLFMLSSLGCTGALLVIGLTFTTDASPWVTLAALCTFMFVFSLGVGPLTFVVASEIFPLHHRGKGVAATVFANRLMSGSIALIFPLMQRGIGGGGAFYVFTLCSLATVVFYYTMLPETKGKSLEEISGLEDSISGRTPPSGPSGVERGGVTGGAPLEVEVDQSRL